MSVSMKPADITRRLAEASEASDLSADRRLDGKLDLSPSGISQRLREASELLDLCVSLRARGLRLSERKDDGGGGHE